VAGFAAIAAGEAVGVLCPQLADAVLGCEVFAVLCGVEQARPAVATVGAESLVLVFGNQAPSRVAVDRGAALLELLGDGAAEILGALCGIDHARDPLVCLHASLTLLLRARSRHGGEARRALNGPCLRR
jgi:hypothetical protein